MKILVTGGSGQLAKCLENQSKLSTFTYHSFPKNIFDITDIGSCIEIIEKIKPDIIINTAAYTKVDQAEKEPDKAYQVNRDAIENLIQGCLQNNVKIIHISTDFVFNGNSNSPYKTHDETDPLSVYGKSKLAGEELLCSSEIDFIIIRTSWVYSQYQSNFVKTMLKLSTKGDKLRIVDDQYGCPTSAIQLAKAIFSMLSDFKSNKLQSGVYHFSGNDKCSWLEFAETTFRISKEIGLLHKVPLLEGISFRDYHRDALTPKYSVLDNSKFFIDFEFKKTSLIEDLKEVLSKIREIK